MYSTCMRIGQEACPPFSGCVCMRVGCTIPRMAKEARLNIRLDADVKRRAQKAAAADQRSLASLIQKLLADYATSFEGRKAAERRK